MKVEDVTPILNISNIQESFKWFAKLGWEKAWDWGEPPTFGVVQNNKTQIFLCQGAQGSSGVWMSWWLPSPSDVDAAYKTAIDNNMTVTMPPTDEPWNVREFHLQHPDGHTFLPRQCRAGRRVK